MRTLGLFLFLIATTSASFAAKTQSLRLRARVPATYSVDTREGRPVITSNIVSTRSQLVVKIEQKILTKNERIVTITHP